MVVVLAVVDVVCSGGGGVVVVVRSICGVCDVGMSLLSCSDWTDDVAVVVRRGVLGSCCDVRADPIVLVTVKKSTSI